MKKIAVLVATNFEDTELIATIDLFSREKIEYDLISVENLQTVKGAYNAFVMTHLLKNVNLTQYDGLFIPGGAGHEIILKNEFILEIVQDFAKQNKLIAAICAAPTILLKAGILKDKRYTSYPGYAVSKNNTGNDVEKDGNIITGKNMQVTVKFAKQVINFWKK